MTHDVHDNASDVIAWKGAVIVDGPANVAVALTPKAAEETGRKLLDASEAAAGQTEDIEG